MVSTTAREPSSNTRVMQVAILNTQMLLGSESVGLYSDATSVPYGQILILCDRGQMIEYFLVREVDASQRNFIFLKDYRF